MTSSAIRLFGALTAAFVFVFAGAARAESIASSASVAGSASVGSLSDSVEGSSDSSSRKKTAAAGEYRIVALAEPADRPGIVRLTLRASDDARRELRLDLPLQTLVRHGLARDMRVQVDERPYGLAFARADTREPFFLALADRWRDQLDPKPVTL